MALRPEHAPRTMHTPELYDQAFGDVIEHAETIADIGAGDNQYYQAAADQGRQVTRVDFQYGQNPPEGDNYIVARASDLSMIPEASHDATVSSFTFQHIARSGQRGEVAQSVKEMVRITRPVDGTPSRGSVAIYPVYRTGALVKLLASLPPEVNGCVGLLVGVDEAALEAQELPTATLLIAKNKYLTDDLLNKVAAGLEEARVFKKRGINIREQRLITSAAWFGASTHDSGNTYAR